MNKITNIKAIILDLDGTLLSPQLNILDETKKVLLQLKDKGIKIIIATGRTPQTSIPMTRSLKIKEPMVLANGALIFDPQKNNIIDSIPISSKTIDYFLSLSKEIKVSLNIYTPECIYIEEDKIDSYIVDSADDRKNLINQELFDSKKDVAVKCEFFGKNQGLNKDLLDLVLKKQKDIIEELYITSAHVNYLEILNKKANKYFGIKKVLNLLNIKDEEIIVFGDSHNDIEMLSKFPHTVAMGNANSEIKKSAKYTTKSNYEDGIAYFIKEHTQIL